MTKVVIKKVKSSGSIRVRPSVKETLALKRQVSDLRTERDALAAQVLELTEQRDELAARVTALAPLESSLTQLEQRGDGITKRIEALEEKRVSPTTPLALPYVEPTTDGQTPG
jgi:uncharacterized coiled-coil DUF342 family protein